MSGPTYSRELWDTAYQQCADAGWEPEGIAEPDELTTTLLDIYQRRMSTRSQTPSPDDPEELTCAAIAAAGQQWSEWTTETLLAVDRAFQVCLDDGWDELARYHLEDHYPGLPEEWVKLDVVARAVARESEVYAQLPDDGRLFVFNRLTTVPA